MLITIDALGEGQSSSSPLTFSHTVASSAVLYVGVMNGFSGSPDTLTSVTYNGVNLSLVSTYRNVTDSGISCSIWALDTPSSGTHNIVITYSDATLMLSGESISLLGTNTSGSAGASNGGVLNGSANTSISTSITTTQANSLIVSIGINNQGTQTQSATGTNQTLQQQQDNTLVPGYGNSRSGLYTQTTTTIGSYTNSFSTTGSSKNLGISAIEVKASTIQNLTLTAANGSFTFSGETTSFPYGRVLVAVTGYIMLIKESIIFNLKAWIFGTKHNSNYNNQSKHNSNWTNQTKH